MSQHQDGKGPEASVNLLEPSRALPPATNILHRYTHAAHQFWILEVSCILIALGAMLGMIGMLTVLNGSPLDSWTLKIGPNTAVSILSGLYRGLIVTVIATCIAQLRWPYFSSAPQRLSEFDTFDGAARGPWGAMKFLLAIPFTKDTIATIASFAACLMILAVAIDPFSQQMLTYETDTVPTTGGPNPALMPVNNGIANGQTLLGRRNAWQAIYGGFLDFDYPLPYQCHGGNCTWPSFVSLGLCSSCQDARSLLSFQCASSSGGDDADCSTITSGVKGTDITLSLKNGTKPPQADTDDSKTYSFVSSAVGSNYPQGLGNSTLFQFITAQLLVNLSNPVPTNFQPDWNLTFCSAQWCARVYENVTVANGMLIQSQTKTFELYEDTTSSCAGSTKCQQFVTRDALGVEGTDSVSYIIDLTEAAADVSQLFNFEDDLSSTVNGTWNLAAAFSVTGALFWGVDMAASAARSASTFSDYLRANHVFSANVQGTTLVRTTFMKVRWEWITLPVILAFLSILLLVAVFIQAISGPAKARFFGKSSVLPFMFYTPMNINQDQQQQPEEEVNRAAAHGDRGRLQSVDKGSDDITYMLREVH